MRVVGFVVAWVLVVAVVVDLAPWVAHRWRRRSGDSWLASNEFLPAGQQIESPDGRHVLRMERGGNLVLRQHGAVTWSSRTATPDSILVADANGNMMVQAPDGTATWSSDTAGIGPAELELRDGGVLRVLDAVDVTHWATPGM